MAPLASVALSAHPLLQRIADGGAERLSVNQNSTHAAVKTVQEALLVWRPGVIPSGATGTFGPQTAAAVVTFKQDENLVAPGEPALGDVGPRTVVRLDEIQRVSELEGWLDANLGVLSSEVGSGSVIPRDAMSAFAAFKTAIERCSGSHCVVAISGWDFFPETHLAPDTNPALEDGTVGEVLKAASSQRQVRIFALLNDFPTLDLPGLHIPLTDHDNTEAVAFFNDLPTGAAIHDKWVQQRTIVAHDGTVTPGVRVGVHHQKIWAVWDGVSLQCFCGGVDLNPNRTALDVPNPLHDVQLEVAGPAAAWLYDLLRKRWNSNPDRPPSLSIPAVADPPPARAPQRTRVVTTFGSHRSWGGIVGGEYPFAPRGSTSYRNQVFHAIDRSRSFIYLEDQYLVDEEVAKKLATAMNRISALIIVVCDTLAVNDELKQGFLRRRRFMAHLAPWAPKIALVAGKRFIHSKVWVFDDQLAIVGSANVNRRGFSHDSEAGIAFGDRDGSRLVPLFRQGLWSLALGPHAPPPSTAPAKALPVWKAPPPTANVITWDPATGSDPPPAGLYATLVNDLGQDGVWDAVLDP